HGPEILLVLCCSSLPSAYAARKGVQVLHRTAYLAKRPTRRLFETSQMIIDVLTPGGLGPLGRGLRTIQKVRLMHAAVRHLILHDERQPWDMDGLGLPINQEDLLGTLMTFSWLIVDGLQRIEVQLTPDQAQAYTTTWMHIGDLMGIEPALLPSTVAETRQLSDIIEHRQVAPSPEGREMTTALLDMMAKSLPPHLSSLPAGLIREFLPGDVADGLGVPNLPLDRVMQQAATRLVRPFERLVDRAAGRHVAIRVFAILILRWMQSVELGDRRASFAIPTSLADAWSVTPASSEDSFWEKLRDWEASRL
ncbi:MAG: oxygenase MpaB family protein, partial [Vicinamibacterales bacterium]